MTGRTPPSSTLAPATGEAALAHAAQLLQQGQAAAALAWLQRLQASPLAGQPALLAMLGHAQAALGQFDAAVASYRQALQARPEELALRVQLANLLQATGRAAEALRELDHAATQAPQQPVIHFNRGNALMALGAVEQAERSFAAAAALAPTDPLAPCNQAYALIELRRYEAACDVLQTVLAAHPQLAPAWHLLGVAWQNLSLLDQAQACYQRALELAPELAAAHSNLAQVLAQGRQYDQALAAVQKAVDLEPNNPVFLRDQGMILRDLQRFDAATACLQRALTLQPELPHAASALLDIQVDTCDWPPVEAFVERLRADLQQPDGKLYAEDPWLPLNWPLTPAQLQTAIRRAVQAKLPPAAARLAAPASGVARPERLRIAYVSADFHQHATAYLMAELIERHDRTRFEIVGACIGRYGDHPDDAMRARLRRGFDHFESLQHLSDAQAAQWLRTQGIHVAVDLKGHTKDARMGIFCHRAAPLQLHYLGYPGTLAMPEAIDYLVADAVVMPTELRPYCSEKIITLPDTYQVNDRQRAIDPRTPTRAQLGLPESGFVFCCFNNNYKITRDVFSLWMELLRARPGSVLWLLQTSSQASANLRAAAQSCGVAAERLVFAPRAPLPEHLARHAQADLFLDTLHFNAHTTASDALWAGLPVLTVPGQTFASRVAASLLTAAGLPELIGSGSADYLAKALHFSQHTDDLALLRQRLKANRLTVPLFDAERFARHLEDAFDAAWERYRLGLDPDHIDVPARHR